jgi:putative ABC transport system permease protein
VKDFHTTSLEEKVEPLILVRQNRYYQAGIKIDMQNSRGALAAIKSAWLSIFPQNVFDYSFLDDTIAHFYEGQQKTARTINTFTFIAIFIGCLGLFGLASYMSIQRTKEIGIRKVLGSTVTGVVTLLSKDFLKLVFLANLIAWPVAWYVMNRWLQNFAYRIRIGWWIFALAGGLAWIITLLTVSIQAIKAAMANPIASLRYE